MEQAAKTALPMIEPLTSVRLCDGTVFQRVLAHAQLPFLAGLTLESPAVQVWTWQSGTLVHVVTIDGEDDSADADGPHKYLRQDVRGRRLHTVAWHPKQAVLAVNRPDGVAMWSPERGVWRLPWTLPDWKSEQTKEWEAQCGVRYLNAIAFSPDGTELWCQGCAIDVGIGAERMTPRWDTGVAVWPSGQLALSYMSDQSVTVGLFISVNAETTPATLSVLDCPLILEQDGYETPIISPDGRYLALRGGAYEVMLDVYELPGLNQVLGVSLAGPDSSFAEFGSWSSFNIAFGDSGALWVGTPQGTLVTLDVATTHAKEFEMSASGPVTSLARGIDGILVATGDGGLHLVRDSFGPSRLPTDTDVASQLLATSHNIPYDGSDPDGLFNRLINIYGDPLTLDEYDNLISNGIINPPPTRIALSQLTSG